MKILITGSGGQLGSELCRQLGSHGVGVDLPQLDLTDRAAVGDLVRSIRPDAIINTAAFTQVDAAEQQADLCRAVNVDGVSNLVEACRPLDCRLVQISTDYVFDGVNRHTPYREDDRPNPQGVYAISKLDGERHAQAYAKSLIVRTGGLYGRAGPRSTGCFVETMLRLGAAGKELRVVDDQRCSPSYVAQVARAVRFLLDRQAEGIYHVVNSGETSWYDLALEVFRQSGMDVSVRAISTSEYGSAAPRPAYSVLDTRKYQALPGRAEMPDWPAALGEYLAAR